MYRPLDDLGCLHRRVSPDRIFDRVLQLLSAAALPLLGVKEFQCSSLNGCLTSVWILRIYVSERGVNPFAPRCSTGL